MRSLVVAFALLVTFAGGRAEAGKPTLAVFTLEAVGADGDPDLVEMAEDLSDALRTRLAAGSGPYTMAPNSNQSLVELKLLYDCEDEAITCMVHVADALACDRMLYGRIAFTVDGYQVTLKLVNAETKVFERTISEVIPLDERKGAALAAWGKRLYGKLTGTAEQGTLQLRVNVDRGTVYLDGEARGNITGGTARIAGLEAGRYQLAIEAECYGRYEELVTIDGEETLHQVELTEPAGACGDGDGDDGDEEGEGGKVPAVKPSGGCAGCGAGAGADGGGGGVAGAWFVAIVCAALLGRRRRVMLPR